MDGLTFTCPVCGVDVPRKAKACPECGACEKSGWSRDQYLDDVNLPSSTLDYMDSAGRERGSARKKTGMQRFWLIIAILIIVSWLAMMLRGLW